MDDSETNTETTERFINAVAMHSVIYDYTNKNYKDQDIRNNVWRAIATEFDTTGTYSIT